MQTLHVPSQVCLVIGGVVAARYLAFANAAWFMHTPNVIDQIASFLCHILAAVMCAWKTRTGWVGGFTNEWRHFAHDGLAQEPGLRSTAANSRGVFRHVVTPGRDHW